MSTSICIAPATPEIAFRELHETWVSARGSWKVEAVVKCLDSLPKFKVRNVRIYHKTKEDLAYNLIELNPELVLPPHVLTQYNFYLKLVKEF